MRSEPVRLTMFGKLLDYGTGDEGLLTGVARQIQATPEQVMQAQAMLAGPAVGAGDAVNAGLLTHSITLSARMRIELRDFQIAHLQIDCDRRRSQSSS